MKFVIILAMCAAAVAAAPATDDKDAVILRQDSDVQPDGFSYGYETSSGIKADEEGHLTNPGTDNEAISVRGQYSFTGPDGVVYQVTYISDENGFQPQGAHLPVAPQ